MIRFAPDTHRPPRPSKTLANTRFAYLDDVLPRGNDRDRLHGIGIVLRVIAALWVAAAAVVIYAAGGIG